MNDAAIVTVRNSSSRLPNKAIMKVKGDLTAIDIVIKRAKKTGFPVIIATSTAKEDDIFEDVAKRNNVSIFRGSLLNKIKRWFDCFNEFKINNALLVDGDDLSYNYEIGTRAISELKEKSVDLITHPKNIVTGFFTYAVSKEGINKLYSKANLEETNTDVITRFIEKSNLSSDIITLEDFEKNEKVRFTLDYQEDLEFFRKLYEENDILTSGKEILEYLESHKEIIEINFHRQKEFLENQAKFNEKIT
ncbi:cytidylyltransferase [Candidatus Nitrosopumilus salaria BD31]|uniref:Cytidylyltransferase n=1 Tax=Candidatus Nitrosopumilus salarius BD31 TaxID=859350 RepID=I3D5A4_9ARCH|nr:acylneuraminate cytidylyltransferase [Candidatus Nitrosopumilus salaria]EIJ66897.1 cytidylyltransferase [Candidatus Nitrosopumilus salaria BD31]